MVTSNLKDQRLDTILSQIFVKLSNSFKNVQVKEELWGKLSELIRLDSGCTWAVCGDFNKVRFPAERKGSLFGVRGASSFNDFINTLGLAEPHLGAENSPGVTQMGPNKAS